MLHYGLQFLLAENRVLGFEHVNDTVLADIEGLSVVVHLAGNFPAV